MFQEISAADARAKFSELLRAVAAGQRYTITVRGKAVADILPCEAASGHDAAAAVVAMQAFLKVSGITAKQIVEMISDGRR